MSEFEERDHALDDIVQIIPADGWTAHYRMDAGSILASPLVAFGLTRGGEVVALDIDCTGAVDRVDTTSNVCGFASPRGLQVGSCDEKADDSRTGNP